MQIFNLLAEHGDAFVIKTTSAGKPYTIVVDGGPGSTDERIASYYQRLGHIDLMVLTHYDEDHIAGIKAYAQLFSKSPMPVGRFWGNCAREVHLVNDPIISDTGNRNAGTLAYYLDQQRKSNPSFEWREDIYYPHTLELPDVKITVLSPNSDSLNQIKEEYESYIAKHPIVVDEAPEQTVQIASVRVMNDAKETIENLAKDDKPRSVNPANKASIAFLLETEGKTILMLGDADADIVADSIETLKRPLPLKVDYVKVSHHGSRNNISKRLLSLIDCNNYIFSTNGGTGRSYHPDRKTLALILRKEHRNENPINFFFNYPLDKIQERTRTLLSSAEKKQENCEIQDDTNIITL